MGKKDYVMEAVYLMYMRDPEDPDTLGCDEGPEGIDDEDNQS